MLPRKDEYTACPDEKEIVQILKKDWVSGRNLIIYSVQIYESCHHLEHDLQRHHKKHDKQGWRLGSSK
jgi:hypothetical protein